MNLSDYKGEDALDLLADILEPATEIFSDTEFRNAVREKMSKMEIVKMLLKRHKKSILQIMAIIDGADPETYKPNVFTLPIKLLELFNDKEFLMLFQSQGQMNLKESSGSAMGSTKENG